ncbi:MAG: hypothetical protein GEU94_19075 [Micromonosporaceae bacterium]|nr:hypothetical protein [Micromonosporaceae bacterium]
MEKVSRAAAEQDYAEAVRTANRASLMGALGFGLALVTGALFIEKGSLLAPGFGLESILLTGGLAGGLIFSVLALRASRMARRCQQALEE